MIVARSVFYLSLAATLLFAFVFAADFFGADETFLWPCVALAMVVAFLVTFAAALVWPSFLTVAPTAWGRFIGRTVVWTILVYIGGAVAIIGLAYLLMPPNYLNTEAALGAFLLALWLPLWFAPAAGLWLGWWRMRSNRRQTSPDSVDTQG